MIGNTTGKRGQQNKKSECENSNLYFISVTSITLTFTHSGSKYKQV